MFVFGREDIMQFCISLQGFWRRRKVRSWK